MPLAAVPLGDLSEQQLEAIDKARKTYLEAGGVLDEYDVPFLARHLVPHKWRAEKAQKSLKTTAEWRQSSGANRIRAQLLRNELKFAQFPGCQDMLSWLWLVASHGHARNGNVASFVQVGSMTDPSVWLDGMSDEGFYEFNLHIIEYYLFRADVESARQRTLIRSTVLYDCANCSSKQFSWRLVRRLNTVLPLPDLYYPELIGETIACNAPWIINFLWGAVRVVLSREIQARVVICSKDSTPETVAALIDASETPSFVLGHGSVTSMTPEKAEELGFAALTDEQLDALLVNKSEPPQEYRIRPRRIGDAELEA